jgi:hypothetical protein
MQEYRSSDQDNLPVSIFLSLDSKYERFIIYKSRIF